MTEVKVEDINRIMASLKASNPETFHQMTLSILHDERFPDNPMFSISADKPLTQGITTQ